MAAGKTAAAAAVADPIELVPVHRIKREPCGTPEDTFDAELEHKLGGDSAHDKRLLTGERKIASMLDPSGRMMCAHANKGDAKDHIERVRWLLGRPKVHVLLAHDHEWYKENKDGVAFLPGVIPPKV